MSARLELDARRRVEADDALGGLARGRLPAAHHPLQRYAELGWPPYAPPLLLSTALLLTRALGLRREGLDAPAALVAHPGRARAPSQSSSFVCTTVVNVPGGRQRFLSKRRSARASEMTRSCEARSSRAVRQGVAWRWTITTGPRGAGAWALPRGATTGDRAGAISAGPCAARYCRVSMSRTRA